MVRLNATLILLRSVVAAALLALPGAIASAGESSAPWYGPLWNVNLQVYWGALYGRPADTGSYFGVQPGTTDGYELLDSLKPAEPMGNNVYAWFERPSWGQGPIMCDYRTDVPNGGTKQWGAEPAPDPPGLPTIDYWGVRTNLNLCYPVSDPETLEPIEPCLDDWGNPVLDPCWGYLGYPVAASIYITWEFGLAEGPPYPLPPDDYVFTTKYKGGINPKRPGIDTESPSVAVPAFNATWDMRATPYIVVPIWSRHFQPFSSTCDGYANPDMAKFIFIVANPDTTPTCTLAVDQSSPQRAPATFDFAATISGDEPYPPYGWGLSWDFGDGGFGTWNPISHTYDTADTYAVTCTVTDTDGDTGACTMQVTVEAAAPPTCDITYSPDNPTIGMDIEFDSHAQAEAGVASVDWLFGDGASGTGVETTHAYRSHGTGGYLVTCTVTDNDGQTTTCSVAVTLVLGFSLQFALDRLGYTIDVPAHYSGVDIDPKGYRQSTESDAVEAGGFLAAGAVEAIVQTRSSALEATFGYFQQDCTPLLSLPDWEFWIDPAGPACAFAPSGTFGLYIEAGGWLFPSDVGWPPDGFDYFMLLPAKVGGVWVGDDTSGHWEGGAAIPDTYVCCWEDWKQEGVGGDADFQDVVVRVSGIEVMPGPLGSVCGYVRSAWNAEPALFAGVSVSLFPAATWHVKTDAQGWYCIDRVPPGPRTFSCYAPGFHRYEGVIDVPPGEVLYEDVDLIPVCRVACQPSAPTTDDEVEFDAVVAARAGAVASATWDFGDGNTGSGNPSTHQYAMPATYAVSVTACGDQGPCTTCAAEVVVGRGANLPPACDATYEPADPAPGEDIVFDANAHDPNPWGEIVSHQWDFGDGSGDSGDPATHSYGAAGSYTACVTVADDEGGQTTCCVQVTVAVPCYCDIAIQRTHCKMPAAGHVGQSKIGQIGARNMSLVDPCEVVLRVADDAGTVVFETIRTIGPGRTLRARFQHCYTPDEVGRSTWHWETWGVDCRERTPWNNVCLRRVNVHP